MIRVLIVDDQDDIRFLMRLALERTPSHSFAVGEARSGEDALALLDQLDPAVVVLDEMMPGLSGVETAARILARRPGQAILMCSARMDLDLRLRAEAVGVRRFLSKGEITSLPGAVSELSTD